MRRHEVMLWAFGAAAVPVVAFVLVEQRLQAPLIDLELFRQPMFVGAAGVSQEIYIVKALSFYNAKQAARTNELRPSTQNRGTRRWRNEVFSAGKPGDSDRMTMDVEVSSIA
ncbi:hypothetical protein ABGB18_45320 [Nonomuraea sp. B12E4]|uniref:hypothetical protein n=1 Tax=Nonomuraea sp. B12E4 TaxID=3153564 RepID=UPI00325F2CF4